MPLDTELDDGVSRLETPISVTSLLKDGVAEFAINNDDILENEEDTNVEAVYPLNELEPFLLTGDCSDDEELNLTHNFEKLSKRMTNVREDGKVKKKIERSGTGGFIPDDGNVWNVYVHYAAYIEFADYPYDATRLRHKKPVKLRLDGLILGMAIAIRSMRKFEKSKFLIHPDLGYKEAGVPPRIPSNATLLFDIELSDFCPAEEETLSTSVSDKPETLVDRIEKAKKCRERGNKRKKQEKDVNGAISQYRKGIFILVESTMADAKEEKEVGCELVKLYSNLAACHLAKHDYRRVCSTYNNAVHDCREKASNSVKLNYLSAKALRFLGDYVEAKKRIRKANKLKQADADILKEMNELKETIAKSNKNEVERARRMFGFLNCNGNSNEEEENLPANMSEVSDEFKIQFNDLLDDFLNDEEKTVQRINTGSLAEMVYCKRLCRSKNILVNEIGPESHKELILNKRML